MQRLQIHKPNKLKAANAYSSKVMISDIHTALRQGYYRLVRSLMTQGHKVNGRDANGQTPLMLCGQLSSERWAVGLARLLLENGAYIGLRDKHGLNSMHYACLYEQLELVRVYLAAVDYDLNAQDREGNTALHYCVLRNNSDILRLLSDCLHRYGLTLDKANKANVTAAQMAYDLGHDDCVQVLLDAGAKLDDKGNGEISNRSTLQSGSVPSIMTPRVSSSSFRSINDLPNSGKNVSEVSSIPRRPSTEAQLANMRKSSNPSIPSFNGIQAAASRSSVPGGHTSRSSVPGEHTSRSSVPREHTSRSSVPGEHTSRSSVPGEHTSRSTVPLERISRSSVPREHASRSSVPGEHTSKSSITGCSPHIKKAPSSHEQQFIQAYRSSSPSSTFRSQRSQRTDYECLLQRLSEKRGGRPRKSSATDSSGRPGSASSSRYPGWFLTQLIECKPYEQAEEDKNSFSYIEHIEVQPQVTEKSVRYLKPSWKVDMMNLLNDYNYQHTKSYLRSITPLPEIEVERAASPNQSEVSEPITEAASFVKTPARKTSPNVKKRKKRLSMYSTGIVSMLTTK